MESAAHANEDGPASPTQYSLDLDALDLDDTEPLSFLPEVNIDRIASSDIDGPTDFTINLGRYINGSSRRQRVARNSFDKSKVNTIHDESRQRSLSRPGSPSGTSKAKGNANSEENTGGARSDSNDGTHSRAVRHDDSEAGQDPIDHVRRDERAGSGHSRASSLEDSATNLNIDQPQAYTQGSSVFQDDGENDDRDQYDSHDDDKELGADQESSIWDPQHNSSSLRFSQMRRPKSLLQPTVEDYNSDLTPARPHSTVPQSTAQLTPDPPRRPVSALNLRPSQRPQPRIHSPDRPSIDNLSPTRALLPNDNFRDSSSRNNDFRALHTELADVQQAQSQAQNAVQTLNAQLEKERQNYRGLRSEFELVRERNYEMEHTAELHRQEHQRQIDDLMNEVDGLRRSEQELLHLAEQRGKDLDAAKHAAYDAQQLADDRAKELDQMHESEDAELQDMRWKLQQAQNSEHATRSSFDELKNHLEEQGRAHDEEVQRLGKDLAAAKSDLQHSRDSEKVANDNLRLLRQQMNEHATALRDETQRLRKELDEAQRQEEHARSDADRYYSELEELKAFQETNHVHDGSHTPVGAVSDEKLRQSEELRLSLERRLHEAQGQLEKLTHERRTNVQETNDNTLAELQKLKEDYAAEQALRKQAEDKLAAANKERTNDQESRKHLEQQLSSASQQRAAEQAARQKAEDEAKALREELDVMQDLSRLDADDLDAPDGPSKDFDELNAGYDKALKLADSLRLEMEVLKKRFQDQRRQHQAKMKSFKQQHDSKIKSIKSQCELDVANVKAHVAAQTEANAKIRAAEAEEHRKAVLLIEEAMAGARQDRAASAAHVSAMKQECELTKESLEKAEQSLAERNALEQDLDKRISEVMKKKEDSWRAKLKEARKDKCSLEDKVAQLEKEKEFMGKVLLGQWGREECGIDENSPYQKYAYKFPRKQKA
ncbi:hypothetical protein AAFC00_000580 [Neodothiora populina]|uniref:Uncharacterized protein n=1 Tax=Neodothiora populina TaxID=2781224 RepID=A0ABR3PDC6_9PEZI